MKLLFWWVRSPYWSILLPASLKQIDLVGLWIDSLINRYNLITKVKFLWGSLVLASRWSCSLCFEVTTSSHMNFIPLVQLLDFFPAFSSYIPPLFHQPWAPAADSRNRHSTTRPHQGQTTGTCLCACVCLEQALRYSARSHGYYFCPFAEVGKGKYGWGERFRGRLDWETASDKSVKGLRGNMEYLACTLCVWVCKHVCACA